MGDTKVYVPEWIRREVLWSEGAERKVIEHETLSRADEIFERFFGSLTPTILISTIVVIHNHQVIVRQRFRTGAAKFLVDANLEFLRVFENLFHDRSGAAPVVYVLAGDNQHLNP